MFDYLPVPIFFHPKKFFFSTQNNDIETYIQKVKENVLFLKLNFKVGLLTFIFYHAAQRFTLKVESPAKKVFWVVARSD